MTSAAPPAAAQPRRCCGLLRDSLAEGRTAVTALLGLGRDPTADDAAAMLLAAFDGVLLHSLVGDLSWLGPGRVGPALERLVASISNWR